MLHKTLPGYRGTEKGGAIKKASSNNDLRWINGSTRRIPRSWLQELNVFPAPEGNWESRSHYLTINFSPGSAPRRLANGSGARKCGPKLRTPARSICLKWQLPVRDRPSLREQGQGHFPSVRPLFLPLHSWRKPLHALYMHSRRKPRCIPESWPGDLFAAHTAPWADLSIAHSVLSCPFSCFPLTGLQDTGPRSYFLLNQPLLQGLALEQPLEK